MDEEGFFARNMLKVIFVVVAVIVIAWVFFPAFHTVPAGHQGIVLVWGKPTEVAQEGLYMWFPSFMKVVIDMPYQTQKYSAAQVSAGTNDLQEATTAVAINYHLDKGAIMETYTNLGLAWEAKVIQPAVEESLKATTAEFTAEQLITKRPEVKNALQESLRSRLLPYGIIVEAVSITDFKFSASFQAAVEAKVTADQNAQKELNILKQIQIQAQQKVAEAEGQAKAQVTIALGNANSTLINAQAQSEAIRLMQEQLSVSPAYVNYMLVQKWAGTVPQFYIISDDGQMVPFIFDLNNNSTMVSNSTGR